MEKYEFAFRLELCTVIEIEAESESEAKDKAARMLHNGEPGLTADTLGQWWTRWVGVEDEQGDLLDEVLY